MPHERLDPRDCFFSRAGAGTPSHQWIPVLEEVDAGSCERLPGGVGVVPGFSRFGRRAEAADARKAPGPRTSRGKALARIMFTNDAAEQVREEIRASLL